jgi:hypothetical protein
MQAKGTQAQHPAPTDGQDPVRLDKLHTAPHHLVSILARHWVHSATVAIETHQVKNSPVSSTAPVAGCAH